MRAHAPLAALLVTTLVAVLASCATQAPKRTSHWARVNGHALYYETGGVPSAHPVLLLHGGGSTIHASFRRQLSVLGKAHQIIAIEQVGQGHTPDVPGPLSYTKMMEDTAALLEQLKLPPVDAVGYSDGAIIALMLAVRHPALVRRLVISGANIDPSGLSDDDLADLQEGAPDSALSTEKASEEAGSADDSDESTDIDEKLRQLWLHSPMPDELSPALLQTIQQRTLVMAGEHDAIRLDHTMLIFHSLPNAELWILPRTGHGTFVSRPKWVNPRLLMFLDAP